MSAVPTVVLRPDRLDFFTDDADTATTSADLACGLYASDANVLTLLGPDDSNDVSTLVRLTGLAAPTAAGDAISAGYLSWKAPVSAAVTWDDVSGGSSDVTYDNGVITGTATAFNFAGTALSVGDRLLVTGDMTTGTPSVLSAAEVSGIYVVGGGTEGSVYTLTRTHDFDTDSSAAGAAVTVCTTGKIFTSTAGAGTLVGDLVLFNEVGAAAPVTPPTPDEPEDLFKASLMIGNGGPTATPGFVSGESIRFVDGTAAVPATGGNAAVDAAPGYVSIHVDGELKLSATAAGGAFVGAWSGSSDEKWKDLLGPISADPLADLDKVDAQSWTWKDGYHFSAGGFSAGIVAQQFQQVCPGAVTFSADQDGLVVDYNALHSFNLSCIKALKQENAARQAEIAALAGANGALAETNAALAARTEALETRLAALEAAFAAHGHS